MYKVTTVSRPFKVKLSDATSSELGKLVAAMQAERDNYQIGVGTLAAELLEKLLAERPELVRSLLMEGDEVKARPSPRKKAPGTIRKAA